MLAYAHTVIDSVQAAKTKTLKTIVTDAKVREPFEAMIEAETQFVKSMTEIADGLYTQFTDQFQKFIPKQ
jgi:hypothetical protein